MSGKTEKKKDTVSSIKVEKSYTGEFKNNLKNGIGTLYNSKGVQYQGEWKDVHKEGKGIMYYANKSRYEGQWEKDKKTDLVYFIIKTEKDTKESMKMIV